jgi:hypothetical protein
MNYSDAADDKNAGGTNYDRLLNYCGEPIHHTRIHLTMGQRRLLREHRCVRVLVRAAWRK